MSVAAAPAGRQLHDVTVIEVKVWMARRGLDQKALAARLGHGNSWVSKRFTGHTAITLDDLAEIADALGVEPAELLRATLPTGARSSMDRASDYGSVVRSLLPKITRSAADTPERSDGPATVCDMSTHLINKWVTAMHAAGRSERTITERGQTVARIARDCGKAPHALTTEDISEWLSVRDLAPISRQTYIAALHAWSVWLIQSGYRDDDPTVRLIKVKVPRYHPHPVTTEQLRAVLDSPIRANTRAMILLAANEGLRVSEIARVRGEDIDVGAHTLRVHGKGNVTATIPLHPVVEALAKDRPHSGYWFPTRSATGHIARTSVCDVVRRAMRRAGVDASAHSLRHWFGTELLNSGADLRTVQTLLRHASLQTTQIYTRVCTQRERDAIDRLPNVA